MSDDSCQFIFYVKKFGWINEFALNTAQAEADRRETTLEFVVLERGLIDATKLDIIRTLQGRNEPIHGYDIEDLLGVGGMGVVYRAKQTALDRVVALKTISVKQLTEKTVLQRFEKEAKTLAQLRHPHIVSAIDFGQQSDRLYFVMEYIQGKDLQQTLFKSPRRFAESEVWEIIRQAASGLSHAAKHDIVHRDIKPANLILEEVDQVEHGFPFHVRIADFGLARLNNVVDDKQLTATNLVVGSPRYMAPEQIDHSGLTPQADVYGLGVTAWEMLSGERPHFGMTVMEIMHEKTSTGLSPLSDLQSGYHPETYELVAAMLNRDPVARPTPTDLLRRIPALQKQLSSYQNVSSPVAIHEDETLLVGNLSDTSRVAQENENHPKSPSRKWILVAGLTCGLLLMALVQLIPMMRTLTPVMVRQNMIPIGRDLALFNGKTISPAQVENGNWIVPKDEPVIAGTNGTLRYILAKREGPIEAYRFDCILQLNKAEEIQVTLGTLRQLERNSHLTLSSNGIEVSCWSNGLSSISKLQLESPSAPHAIQIERQPSGWFVSLDGNHISALPLNEGEQPIIEFTITGGPGWISDVFLTELAMVDK